MSTATNSTSSQDGSQLRALANGARKDGPRPTTDADTDRRPGENTKPHETVNANGAPPLRLGMFGVGGARARDEIGWSEPYPDMYTVQYEQDGVSRHLAAPSNGTPNAAERVVAAETKSCCGSQQEDDITMSHPPKDEKNTAPRAGPQQGSTFGSPVSLYGNALQVQEVVPGANRSSHATSVPDRDGKVGGHDCNCGEGCDCLACLTHPYNKTTLEYVRYHTDIAMRYGEVFSPPSMSGLPGSTNAATAPHSASGINASVAWAQHGFSAGSGPNSHISWQNNLLPQATPTQELDQLRLRTSHTADKVQSAATKDATTPQSNGQSSHAPSSPAFDFGGLESGSGFDPSSPQHPGGETPTLSPSAFFLQSYTLPGCDDATGTCQCGDGCTCVGCLTHTGHQRAQQEAPTSNPYPSHGSGCACPHPEPTQTPNTPALDARNASQHQTPIPYINGHHASPPSNYMPSPAQNDLPVSTFTHIHGPNCACPIDGAVLQAQAQVQAHAQLHGPSCRCATGMTYLTAQLQAEARLHQQLHGDGAPSWAGGPPG